MLSHETDVTAALKIEKNVQKKINSLPAIIEISVRKVQNKVCNF